MKSKLRRGVVLYNHFDEMFYEITKTYRNHVQLRSFHNYKFLVNKETLRPYYCYSIAKRKDYIRHISESLRIHLIDNYKRDI